MNVIEKRENTIKGPTLACVKLGSFFFPGYKICIRFWKVDLE